MRDNSEAMQEIKELKSEIYFLKESEKKLEYQITVLKAHLEMEREKDDGSRYSCALRTVKMLKESNERLRELVSGLVEAQNSARGDRKIDERTLKELLRIRHEIGGYNSAVTKNSMRWALDRLFEYIDLTGKAEDG